MAILSAQDQREIQAQLKDLTGSVKLVNFTQELACQYCRETELLLAGLFDAHLTALPGRGAAGPAVGHRERSGHG